MFIFLVPCGELISLGGLASPRTLFKGGERDNIIHLTGQPIGRALIRSEIYTERMMFMVSWNDLFSFVIMLMAILTYIDVHDRHKK